MARVLIVEDDPAIGRLVDLSLSVAGHEVRVARDMPSAMEVIRDDWPDVVALDWWLEGREASDVIQAAHELKSRARFLIVTAHRAEDAFRQTAADGWLQKPFDPDVLAARIEELAAMGSAGQE